METGGQNTKSGGHGKPWFNIKDITMIHGVKPLYGLNSYLFFPLSTNADVNNGIISGRSQ